jgi:hypothetical protein
MKFGKVISEEYLTREFVEMYRKINTISIDQIAGLTTGQFVGEYDDDETGAGTTVISDLVNRHSDQFFDSMYDKDDVSYFKFYIDEIQSIKEK